MVRDTDTTDQLRSVRYLPLAEIAGEELDYDRVAGPPSAACNFQDPIISWQRKRGNRI